MVLFYFYHKGEDRVIIIIINKSNDREIIYESHELMKIDSVYFSLANSIKTQWWSKGI